MSPIVRDRFLIITSSLAFFVLAYCLIIAQIFSSPSSINSFLKQSGGYTEMAAMIQATLTNRISEQLQDKLIQQALARELIDRVVSPTLIERLAQPVIQASIFVVNQPTQIEQDKVVIDTKPYRDRIASELPEIRIPEVFQPIATRVVNAIPDQLTLVDLKERPNSILGMLIKARDRYQQVITIMWVMWVISLVSLALLIFFNLRSVKTIFRLMTWAFLSVGGVILLLSWAVPYFYEFTPRLDHPIVGDHLNLFVESLIDYYFVLTRRVGWIYAAIGVITLVLWKWRAVDRIQPPLTRFANSIAAPPTKRSTPVKKRQ